MKNKLLSIITPEQLVSELKELGSSNKIAKKYGMNLMTVYSAFEKLGLNGKIRADGVFWSMEEMAYRAISPSFSMKRPPSVFYARKQSSITCSKTSPFPTLPMVRASYHCFSSTTDV